MVLTGLQAITYEQPEISYFRLEKNRSGFDIFVSSKDNITIAVSDQVCRDNDSGHFRYSWRSDNVRYCLLMTTAIIERIQ